ncbi:globin domain-containing protein [Actinomadura parmotrematis]|uniref:nitric oxide dioxygenase n=1 Tax=Actinomadura parmotrematis TaxID=2864039 RepID=A0ABS7G4I3_9ACTN|nr:globin domain-containing protein [Actinomadura parmotrematis]MBW8487641.1 flavohemoprotein [Actinomadura parmotrematis]
MSLERRNVKEDSTHIEMLDGKAAAYFYGRLFAANPRLRAMFPPAMDAQRDRLFQALTKIVSDRDGAPARAAYFGQLGRDHRKYGVRAEHYPAVGEALVATLRRFSGDAWTPEAETAWTAAYAEAARLMTEAAEAAAEQGPPWWVAEVLDHDRRGPDLAVLTLRPDAPLPFAAGQYVTVQTARWPRVWRPYSVANAPRADGTVRLHVRALPGGWVSGALVRHTGPGDAVLLGPPRGGMRLDPDSDRPLLLVAGGTGLAPLKALAEQATMSGRPREVHLLVGARTEADLYDLPELRLLEAACPTLRVVPVLSGPPRTGASHGALPEALERFGGPDDHDVYISGPEEMIRTVAIALRRLGVPPDRVHHDLLDTGTSATGTPTGCPVHETAGAAASSRAPAGQAVPW